MRPATRLFGMATLALGLAFLVMAGSARAQAKDNLKSLSYADLGKEIRALRGKVVVVYFWGFT